jgi:hypothetical protein
MISIGLGPVIVAAGGSGIRSSAGPGLALRLPPGSRVASSRRPVGDQLGHAARAPYRPRPRRRIRPSAAAPGRG